MITSPAPSILAASDCFSTLCASRVSPPFACPFQSQVCLPPPAPSVLPWRSRALYRAAHLEDLAHQRHCRHDHIRAPCLAERSRTVCIPRLCSVYRYLPRVSNFLFIVLLLSFLGLDCPLSLCFELNHLTRVYYLFCSPLRPPHSRLLHLLLILGMNDYQLDMYLKTMK
jgi:hypothetical protein